MIRWELRLASGRTVHLVDATWEQAALRAADTHGQPVVAWRQCQCPRVEVLGDARRIIG